MGQNLLNCLHLRQKASLNLPLRLLKPRQISSTDWWGLSCHLPKPSSSEEGVYFLLNRFTATSQDRYRVGFDLNEPAVDLVRLLGATVFDA